MTRGSSALPVHPQSSTFELAGNTLMTLWRTFWIDLPLVWACEVDRLLYRWIQPADIGDRLPGYDVGSADHIGEVEDDGQRQ
ncbi:hypothetical protein FVE89_13205 [Methylobacterium sp. 2A]|jgi:hypothetical protein|uniref:hypothetical protein n=1 Tax=Methylobacterium sp. 2A TaxID=2603816 RepID=UPI001354AFE6|nr:hypothetical protein [Methylobacterium sp. 2A]MWV22939.1 hypothetical protein [Methylobacterium sp. 2A]